MNNTEDHPPSVPDDDTVLIEAKEELLYNVSDIVSILCPVALCMSISVALITFLSPASRQEQVEGTLASSLSFYEVREEGDVSGELGQAVIVSLIILSTIIVQTLLVMLLVRCGWYRALTTTLFVVTFFMLTFLSSQILHDLLLCLPWPLCVDWPAVAIFLYNFSVAGVWSMFGTDSPLRLRQAYLIYTGLLSAYLFNMWLPPWVVWALLSLLALWDLVAVLCPFGPLNIIIKTISERGDFQVLNPIIYSTTAGIIHIGTPESGKRVAPAPLSPLRSSGSTLPQMTELPGPSMEMTSKTTSGSLSKTEAKSGDDATRSHNDDTLYGGYNDTSVGDVDDAESGHNDGTDAFSNHDVHDNGEDSCVHDGTDAGSDVNDDSGSDVNDDRGGDVNDDSGGDVNDGSGGDVDETRLTTEGESISVTGSTGTTTAERQPPVKQLPSPTEEINQAGASSAQTDEQEKSGPKLGLGDFVFYSLLMGQVSLRGSWDTTLACFISILIGLSLTMSSHDGGGGWMVDDTIGSRDDRPGKRGEALQLRWLEREERGHTCYGGAPDLPLPLAMTRLERLWRDDNHRASEMTRLERVWRDDNHRVRS